jgi:AcrR family transcriptional regulator
MTSRESIAANGRKHRRGRTIAALYDTIDYRYSTATVGAVDAKTRILEAAAELLSRSADAEISTREVCDAAGITVPALYHHFGDKEGLLSAVVDLGWARFLASKRALLGRVHADPLDDIRSGWDNHLAFARENPNFYRLMWSAGAVASSAAPREGYEMLTAVLERCAQQGRLCVSVETAARTVMAAATGAALSIIARPKLFANDGFATHLREAVIAGISAPADVSRAKRSRVQTPPAARGVSLSAAAATLSSKLRTEPTALSDAERALMQQWLTMLADAGARPDPPQSSGRKKKR